MELWGAALYGDPCRECGWDWSIGRRDAVAFVRGVPGAYAGLLRGREARSRHPDLVWSAGAYVCHVTDNLRIWAERLAGAALGGEAVVAGYDEHALAVARRYDAVPVAGALWSLEKAARDWVEAVALGDQQWVVLRHLERGEQRVEDVVRNNAHDAWHHAWDIGRSLLSAR